MNICKILWQVEFSISKAKWLILFFLVFVFIIFKSTFEFLATQYVVLPFLSKARFTVVSDILFFIFLFLLIAVFTNRLVRNYRISHFRFAFFVLLTLIYVYYRNFDSIWRFYDLRTLKIKFFDLIPVNTISLAILFIRNRLPSPPSVQINTTTPFILDTPLDKNDPDILKRTKYANEIASRLDATISERSISIGINGAWGFGKSSFFRLIKNELEKNNNNIIIDFNPWRGYKGDALSVDFFQSLSQSVGIYNELLQINLKKYRDTLLNIDNSLFNSTVKLASSMFDSESVEQQYNEINLALKKLNKKWYFFIDDLDRLSSEEIIEVIKLVRNTADFYNLRFFLAYDKSYLVSALKKLNLYNYETYLEKIILYEYPLLPIDSEQINDELKVLLKKYCSDGIVEEMEIAINNARHGRAIQTAIFLSNLRDVKRFANTFIPSYNQEYKEVSLGDYINFELLRLKYPIIVNQIFFNKSRFLTLKGSILKLTVFTENKVDVYEIEKFIDENMDFLQIENSNKIKLMNLLKSLFTIDQMWERGLSEKSIMKAKNFSIYFRKATDSDRISYSEFEEAISLPLEQIKETLKVWINQKKRTSIVDKFVTSDFFKEAKNQQEYEKLIRVIIFLGNYPKTKDDSYIGYSDEDLLNKLDPKQAIHLFYNNKTEDFKTFVLSILNAAVPPFRTESELLNFLLENLFVENFILTQKEIEDQLVKFYSDYCDTTNLVTDEFWMLYHNCKKGIKNGNTITKEFLPGANIVHQKFVFKNIEVLRNYLERIINIEGRDESTYSISETVKTAFDGFENLIIKLKASEYFSEPFVLEFIEFYEKFATKAFKYYVPFEFKILKARREY